MRLELVIDGMIAVHAKAAVFHALASVDGVERAQVELGRAELDVSEGLDASALEGAIAAVGFTLREVRRLPRTLPTL